MLFWLFVIVLLIGITLIILGSIYWDRDKHHFMWYHDDGILWSGIWTTAISGACVLVSLICFAFNYGDIDAKVAQYEARYEALTYKLENEACRDKFGLLNKETIDEVQSWNEDLAYYKAIQRNFWVGILYPNVYDDFKFIDYGGIKQNE